MQGVCQAKDGWNTFPHRHPPEGMHTKNKSSDTNKYMDAHVQKCRQGKTSTIYNSSNDCTSDYVCHQWHMWKGREGGRGIEGKERDLLSPSPFKILSQETKPEKENSNSGPGKNYMVLCVQGSVPDYPCATLDDLGIR